MDDALLERVEGWQRAIEARDVAAAATYLDEDYALVRVQPAATVMPRAPWLGLLPDYVIGGYVVEERVVDVDVDVATILQRVAMIATVQGVDRTGTFVISDIWRRRDGTWKVWRRHSTPLNAGPLPAQSS